MLSSWKEIASFFGKGVRTVQRWEKTLDLPIRRPPGAPSNVVLARTSDLEEWMHRGPGHRAHLEMTGETMATGLQDAITQLEDETRALQARLNGSGISDADSSGEADPVRRVHQVTSVLRSLQTDGVASGNALRKVA